MRETHRHPASTVISIGLKSTSGVMLTLHGQRDTISGGKHTPKRRWSHHSVDRTLGSLADDNVAYHVSHNKGLSAHYRVLPT